MAEFVTKAESQRRLTTLIVCIIICTLSLVGGIYSIKASADIQDKKGAQETIVELRREVDQLHSDISQIEGNFTDFSRPVGWRTASRGTYDRFATGGVSGNELKAYLDFWVKELSRPGYDIKEFKPWQEGQGTLFLTTLFEKLKEKEEWFRGENLKLKDQLRNAETAAKTATDEIEAIERRNLDEIDRQLKEDYKRLLRDLSTRERQHGDELSTLEVETFTKQRELTELRNKNVKEQTRIDGVRQELENRKSWILYRQEEAKERKEPDGEVLAIDEKYNIVWIDLLHRDRIFKGSRFKVYSLEKGGLKVDKGEIEVLDVREAQSSKAAILKTINEKEPIKSGDRIYNELYEKGKIRYVAIAGRLTGKLSNEEAARKIREFGDIYQDKVDERTNYLVVGDGYDQHFNFALAKQWGVKILLERILYDYLGVP